MIRILSKAKLIVAIAVSVLICQQSNAQYNGGESAVGLRAGGSAGVTYKKFFNKSFAFESILANNFENDYDGIMLSATLQKHVPLAGYKFSALLGAGPAYHFKRGKVGINPVIGFDWRILNSPINLQVDWSPAYYFGADEGLSVINTAFSIRYILNRKKVYGSEDKK
ncbi:hypothetical protein LZZ85_02995 [Terrimonas sp. NA20]|uniref:Outer membrane protein beta-barrel domain-containing protein n=1 Tax=Terrimonas ginsenosidimutans TaxID=2908004 RepID=A0ABS9KLM8_9BACT|nr:hypothetical protein [Terrimonas ginsenosidimutans]MCG2613224.1 hypothetical protein [Terrimonas ginsenosidimutans]